MCVRVRVRVRVYVRVRVLPFCVLNDYHAVVPCEMQAMAFFGGENEARKHIDGLILELHKVLNRQYQVTTNVRVQIGLKFFLGDHKALGIMLSHRMGMLWNGGNLFALLI